MPSVSSFSGAGNPEHGGARTAHTIPPLRWGILGCANIARKNARAIYLAENQTLVAVASRDKAKCEAWVAQHGCAAPGAIRCYGSYPLLLADAEVDAVYIPLPTALHREWVPRAAAAGKHILLEKPVALSVADLDVMIQACDTSDVCFMDGVMFMHHDRLRAVLGHISPPGFFGRPTRITSAFTFKADAAFLDGGDIRVRADGDPLGCIGDLGWYCIRIALCCALYEAPQKVRCLHMERNADGVPVDATVEIYWPGMVLHFHCSFMHPLRQWVEVVGGDRVLRIDDFVINKSDSQYTIEHGAGLADYDTVPTGTSQTYTMAGCTQEARMFENFAIETLAPTPRTSTNLWWYVAATTQACCDAVMESAGKGGAEVAVAKSSIAFAANDAANETAKEA